MSDSFMPKRVVNIPFMFLNNIKYVYKNDVIKMILKDGCHILTSNINQIVNRYNSKNLDIVNINDVKELNDLFKALKGVNYDENIRIYLNIGDPEMRPKYHVIDGLENRSRLAFDSLPGNVQINGFFSNHSQTEFTTYSHNLSEEGKKNLYRVLDDNSKDHFLAEERIIKQFIEEILNTNKKLLEMPKKDQFEYIFDYIKENFLKCDEALSGYFTKHDFLWTEDPIEVYKNRSGISKGKANLLTLVTNNSFLRLKCTTVIGKINGFPHTWNQFIDEDGKVYDYDIDNNIKHYSYGDMKNINYSYDRIYPIVKNTRNKEKKLIK